MTVNWSCRHFAARAFDAARFSLETSALHCPGRNPRISAVSLIECSCKWMSSITLRARGRSPKWLTPRSVSVHEGATLFRIGSVAPKFSLRYGSDDGFDSSMGISRARGFAKLHQGGINRNAGQPSCKLGSSIKSLRWTKAFRKHSCSASSASSRFLTIRRVTQETFFIWRSQSSPKGALRPLLAAAINCSSLHARRSLKAEASLCSGNNVLITTIDLSRTGAVKCWLLIFSPFPSTRDVLRTVLQLHPTASQSLRNFTASRSASLTSVSPKRSFCSPHQRGPSTPRPPPRSSPTERKNMIPCRTDRSISRSSFVLFGQQPWRCCVVAIAALG